MKKLFTLSAFVFLSVAAVNAQSVLVSASEADAKIIVDGQNMGTGTLKVKVPNKGCVNVRIEKPGFLRYEQTYCDKKGVTEPPKKQFFNMEKDDAEMASVKTDQANVDFSIVVKEAADQTDAWKLVSQIVTDYFDAIEVSDKETSYLRTAWSVQTFAQNTIRTRLIIKLADSDPLTYKVKLVSESSGKNGTSVKGDELFREWDRILRKYQNVVSDFSTRLGNQ